MKIAVLGINFYPELTGIAVYNTEMCKYLKEQGHQVTVFTAFPYYPQWRISRKYKKRFFKSENYCGITVKRSYLYVPNKVTTRTRILHELSFMISSFFNILFSPKPDILITVSPPLGLGIVAYIVSKIKRVPFIFHIQDLQPDAAVELGMLKNKRILNLLYKIEKFIYARAAKVGVISKKMGEKVALKEIKQEKILFFPNWVDVDYIKPLAKNNEFRKENGLNNQFVILYSGNIGYKQGLDILLKMADRTKDNENIIYLIVGDGAYKKKLVEKHERLKLENIMFIPVQSRKMLPYMLSSADISLIPQQKTVTDIVMPSKLLGIMASGRPVIAGANEGSELYNVITNSECGIAVEPENSEKMLDTIIEIYGNPEKGEKYGRKGREYACKYFSKEKILPEFEKELLQTISRR